MVSILINFTHISCFTSYSRMFYSYQGVHAIVLHVLLYFNVFFLEPCMKIGSQEYQAVLWKDCNSWRFCKSHETCNNNLASFYFYGPLTPILIWEVLVHYDFIKIDSIGIGFLVYKSKMKVIKSMISV